MRLSVPGIPQAILNAGGHSNAVRDVARARETLFNFIRHGNVTVLTGAGVSVDSGIRAYRGEDGRYMNPNYKPLYYHELVDSTSRGHSFRQRYWLRSYLGYPHVRNALPNTTHYAIAALQYAGIVTHTVTQNVDGFHHKAAELAKHDAEHLQNTILELHGTLHKVHCNRGHVVDRGLFQDWLSAANPSWYQYALEIERTGERPRTNPDGDVDITHLGASYDDFNIPPCPSCLKEDHINSVHKPEVIFFGESIPSSIKKESCVTFPSALINSPDLRHALDAFTMLRYSAIEQGDRLLLIGTTLATYSAFRLLKHALELRKPVMMLNIGPTRGDDLPLEKIEVAAGLVMRDVARDVITISGPLLSKDSIISDMLASGVMNPPSPHDGVD